VAEPQSPSAQPKRLRASALLDYPFSPPASDGSVVEVAPGILWARMPMPMALDHINVYLLREAQGWTVIDTGLNTEAGKTLWEHIAAAHLDNLPILRLICTHGHYDHAGLAAWIMERFDVPLFMTYGEYYMIRGFSEAPPDPLPPTQQLFYQRTGMKAEQIDRMFDVLRKDPFMPPIPPTYQRLREGDRIGIGERQWRVVIGEGHSPEHACLYCDEDHILIAGDQVLPRITSNVLVGPIEPEANPLQLWLQSLDRLDHLAQDTLVLPSHQNVFRGLHARVDELRAHHQMEFELLCHALAQQGASTAMELMQVQFPKRRHAADDLLAMGETIAHLSWLRYAGRVQRVLDENGCHRFTLAI